MKLLVLFIILSCASLYAQTTIYYRYDVAGNRKYRGLDVNGVFRKEDSTSLKKDTVLIEGHTIRVFPNPTEGKLNISIDNLKKTDQASYNLIDTKGDIILSKQSITKEIVEADLSTNPVGQYYIEVILNDKRTVWKIIKY